LAFREFALRVRLLANILGGAPHPRSKSGNHRVSFLTGYSFLRVPFLPKVRMVCQEETEGPGKNAVAEWTFFFVAKAEAAKAFPWKRQRTGNVVRLFRIRSTRSRLEKLGHPLETNFPGARKLLI
jgi:hypothetical protein